MNARAREGGRTEDRIGRASLDVGPNRGGCASAEEGGRAAGGAKEGRAKHGWRGMRREGYGFGGKGGRDEEGLNGRARSAGQSAQGAESNVRDCTLRLLSPEMISSIFTLATTSFPCQGLDS